MIRMANPWFLLLLALLPGLYLLHRWVGKKARATLIFSDISLLKSISGPAWFRHIPLLLRFAVLLLAIIALSRPQSGAREEVILTEGVDIVMAIDISGSMAAEDFKPKNRLHVAKLVVEKFIQGRQNDRIGLVTFADYSYTKCPLTLDYQILGTLLENVQIAPRGEDGTAIGMGLATAVNRLRKSVAASRVIILLTDGRNNRGKIDPETAAEIASSLGIRVHTIGVGTEGTAPFPVNDPLLGRRQVFLPASLDEDSLRKIAKKTKGLYFRATDTDSLATIFRRIDQMEKTEIQSKEYVRYSELFPFFLLPASLLLGTELVFRQTRFRRIP